MTSTPRIPPKGNEPDKNDPTQHRKVEKIEKIEKVAEVDDESRARQFRMYVEMQPEESSDLPTPFSLFGSSGPLPSNPASSQNNAQSFFDKTDDSSSDELAQGVLPNPGVSLPPSAQIQGTSMDDDEQQTPLPRSGGFWGSVDESSDSQPLPQSRMEETPRSASRSFMSKKKETETDRKPPERSAQGKKSGGKKDRDDRKAEFSPFGPPGKPTAAHSSRKTESKSDKGPFFSAAGKKLSGKKDEELESLLPEDAAESGFAPPARSSTLSKENKSQKYMGPLPEVKGPPHSVQPLKQAEEKGAVIKSKARIQDEDFADRTEKPSVKPMRAASREERSSLSKEEGLEEKKGRKKSLSEDEERTEIVSPTLQQLPASFIPIAGAAATEARPFLEPEALSMYYYMVGTISAMVSPNGDSRMEFVLNSPSFAASKFYGATITIERFSTAPYQLNIRLSGSNEAVNSFNQNIPNLLAAFKNGQFPYVINRIDAVYRPLFHRKESAKGKDFGNRESS